MVEKVFSYGILPVVIGAVVAALMTLIIQPIIAERSLIKTEKWKIKQEACLEALNLADAMLSNYSWENVKEGDIIKEEIKTVDVRHCYNKLACSCDNKEILILFKKIFFGEITPDIIVDLRNAVRKELDFGIGIDEDRKKAYFGKLFCDPTLSNTPKIDESKLRD